MTGAAAAILAATDRPLIRWDWIQRNLDDIGAATLEHLKLTGIAVGIGFAISLPLAIYAYRHRGFYGPLTWVTGFLYTIPSLALFILLIPVTGLGTVTAEIALVSYTLLILIRNIVAGLSSVPADVKEAARGMGYSGRQLLWRVEIPLAMPAIMAGLRVATVTTVGLATIAVLIGAGGLGSLINLGIQRLFATPTIVGAAIAVAMAIAADVLLLGLLKLFTPWTRRVRAA